MPTFSKSKIISLAIIVVILMLSGYWLMMLKEPSAPEERILGTWIETSLITAEEIIDYTSPERIKEASYYGFVANSDRNILREYHGTDKLSMIVYVDAWKLKQSKGMTILEKFYTFTSADDILNGELAESKYQVLFPSPNKLILKKLEHDESVNVSYPQEIHYKRVGTSKYESYKNFTRTTEEVKKVCDDIFTGTSGDESLLLPISCTRSIGQGEGDATFTFTEKGSLEVVKDGKLILSLENDEQISIVDSNSGYFLNSYAISFPDITYDGYMDIEVLTGAGFYNFIYDYYAYDPKTKSYGAEPILSDITNPGVDPNTKNIESYHKGRVIGDLYVSKTYNFENGTYVLVREESQNCVDVSCDEGYVHIISELRNGKMVVVKEKKLTTEEVFGE